MKRQKLISIATRYKAINCIARDHLSLQSKTSQSHTNWIVIRAYCVGESAMQAMLANMVHGVQVKRTSSGFCDILKHKKGKCFKGTHAFVKHTVLKLSVCLTMNRTLIPKWKAVNKENTTNTCIAHECTETQRLTFPKFDRI